MFQSICFCDGFYWLYHTRSVKTCQNWFCVLCFVVFFYSSQFIGTFLLLFFIVVAARCRVLSPRAYILHQLDLKGALMTVCRPFTDKPDCHSLSAVVSAVSIVLLIGRSRSPDDQTEQRPVVRRRSKYDLPPAKDQHVSGKCFRLVSFSLTFLM